MSITKGQIIEGVVSRITNFGAFVELPGGTTGLVHISEVADSYVKDVNDFLKQDEKVKVKVINIDERGRIGLSIRKAEPKSERPPERTARPPSRPFKAKPKPQQSKEVAFEDKITKFFKDSSERLAPLNTKNDFKRNKTSNRG